MKQIIITPRVIDRNCKKCGREMEIGENAMVQRNQAGGHYCMQCWDRMCIWLHKTNLTSIITQCLEKYLDMGITNKDDIFEKVTDELGVAKPIVRRVARDLRTEMTRKIKILQSEVPLPSDQSSRNEGL